MTHVVCDRAGLPAKLLEQSSKNAVKCPKLLYNRFCEYLFWPLAAFSRPFLAKYTSLNFSKRVVYLDNRFIKNWAASKGLEQDECQNVASDYVKLFLFFFIIIFSPHTQSPNVLCTIGARLRRRIIGTTFYTTAPIHSAASLRIKLTGELALYFSLIIRASNTNLFKILNDRKTLAASSLKLPISWQHILI